MISFISKNYLKVIPFLLILLFLFFGFSFLYNKNEGALAQTRTLQCDLEIPLGEALDRALYFGHAILSQMEVIMAASSVQTTTADVLADLPEDCKADNCETGCNEFEVCDDWDDDGKCISRHWECDVLPCTGQACPPYGGLLTTIQNAYAQIDAADKEIERLIKEERTPTWITILMIDFTALEISRIRLRNCVTPAEAYFSEEEAGQVEWLVTCQEAKYLRLFDKVVEDEEEKEEGACYLNNFYCCEAHEEED